MQTKPLLGALAVLALAGATAVWSQPHGRPFGPPPLAQADTNNDGAISSAEWTALFTKLDADHNGKVEGSELPGPPHGPGALAFMLSHDADANKDGKVTLDEFKARIAKLDKDGDGALSLAELPFHGPGRGAGSATGDNPPPFFEEADSDQDGKLEVSELVALFDAAAADHDGVLPVHSMHGRR